MPTIEVSFGELVDKYTILQIKYEQLKLESQKTMVYKELSSLKLDVDKCLENENLVRLASELKDVNLEIWFLMDELYSLDAPSVEYAQLTWDITIQNQKRAFLKKTIDSEMKSRFSEEKSFFSQTNQRIV
jgi:hypothetical protein